MVIVESLLGSSGERERERRPLCLTYLFNPTFPQVSVPGVVKAKI